MSLRDDEGTARWVWTAGCVAAALAVAAGAFGAHGLRPHLSAERLAVWETAARYQMYHALAMLAVAAAAARWPGRGWGWPAALLVAGMVLFSGSLYLLALTGVGVLGAVTPLGGVAWLIAWGLLARAGARGTASPR